MNHAKMAASLSGEREIVITRLLDAPRELVWQAFTDREHVGRWWGPEGFTTTTHEIDVRPGGVWRFLMHGPDGRDYPNRITFLEVVRPARLVYRHGGDLDVEPVDFQTTVTLDHANGKTRLTIRMVFPSAKARDDTARTYGAVEGLTQTVNRLEAYLPGMARADAKEPLVLRVTRRFDAGADEVFDAWLDPQHAGQWLFATPDGEMARVEIDARVGGRFVIVERRDGVDAYHGGVYLEIDRPRRLVFTFALDEQLIDAGRVQVDIEPLPDGGCELTLTHEMAARFAEYKERTQEGWTKILEALARLLH